MSFWSQNTTLSSSLDDLLSRNDVTLQELLDEPEVLQECKSQNKKLIEFLAKPDVLRELIVLTTRVPVEENGETVRYKYASIACELLTSEITQIIETLANETSLLDELYAFLESPAPLNPLLASFYCRIIVVLISKTNEQNWFSYQVSCLQVLEYLKSKGNCIALLVQHLGTSAIMDLILKMYDKIEGDEIRENFLTWLDEGEFLEQLLANMNASSPPDVLTNVCQLVGDLILTGREHLIKTSDNQDQDRLIRKIESEAFINGLLDKMFVEPRCERSIVGGISVLLILLGSFTSDEHPIPSWDSIQIVESSNGFKNSIAAITARLPHILDLLHNPPPKPNINTSVGVLEPPLGATRVELARLTAALVNTADKPLLEEIQRLDLLNVILDLFFLFPWNNFLHAHVEATLVAAFKAPSIAKHIFTNCRIIQRILDAWADNDAQEKNKKPRRGYMGHVINISNYVADEGSSPPLDSVLLETVSDDILTQWKEFVGNALAKVNGDQNSGSAFQNKRHNDSDSENYYNEALAPAFAENFCDERQLETGDETMDASDARALKPGFPDAESDDFLAKQAEILFNRACSQKLQSLNDDAEFWSSMKETPSESQERAWNDDGSSDEENAPGQDDDWPDVSGSAPVEQSNPWSADVLTAASPPDPGWANFDYMSPFMANFGYELKSTIATSAPDAEAATFDLTPTEVAMMPSEDDDWATNTLPPTDWSVTPPDKGPSPDSSDNPSELVQFSAVNPAFGERASLDDTDSISALAEKVIAKEMETIKVGEVAKDEKVQYDVATEDQKVPEIPQEQAKENRTLDVDQAAAILDEPITKKDNLETTEKMETAQIVESENAMEIVIASDVICRNNEVKACIPESAVAVASETVISARTEGCHSVEEELAQLLAEVSLPAAQPLGAQGDTSQAPPPVTDSLLPNQVPVADNEIEAEESTQLVPNTTSKIAVNEDEVLQTAAPTDVTAI